MPNSNTTPSVRQSVHVAVEPTRAFNVFTTRVASWWIRKYSGNPAKTPIADIVLQAREGGRWYEQGTDGSECEWARVLKCDPPRRLLVSWLMAGAPTQLEVCFDGPAPRRTDVTVVHSGFEVLGGNAESMRAAHDAAWKELLAAFAAEVERQSRAGHEATAGGSARSVTDGETILAAIDVAARPDRVFRALTTAECEQWWGEPEKYATTNWKSDTQVGGAWSVDTRLADGSIFPASGKYLEVEAPRRLVLTRRYDWDYPEFGRRDTRVTYLLDSVTDGTRVTVRQDGFAGFPAAAAHHAEGWEGFLKYLDRYLQTAVE